MLDPLQVALPMCGIAPARCRASDLEGLGWLLSSRHCEIICSDRANQEPLTVRPTAPVLSNPRKG